jgi:formylglycine-generating enzyme required for sulfatase activity
MSGNVREWVGDWNDEADPYYPHSPPEDPPGPEGSDKRVQRGGSWRTGPVFARSAHRTAGYPDRRQHGIGFRIAQSVTWQSP